MLLLYRLFGEHINMFFAIDKNAVKLLKTKNETYTINTVINSNYWQNQQKEILKFIKQRKTENFSITESYLILSQNYHFMNRYFMNKNQRTSKNDKASKKRKCYWVWVEDVWNIIWR